MSEQDKANPPPYRRKEVIGNATLYLGDSTEVLPIISGVHACVTDPPYHLTSVSRNGSPRTNDPETPFGRTRLGEKGFMGKTWDGGDIAFREELWGAVSRALLPGAHLLAFSGSRTYHRMACAIEYAGLDIRDQIMWLYGSGFPKSHNLDPFSFIETQNTFEEWGTALKPAHEPIVFARKPFPGTVAENVLEHGTAALNIGASRISYENDVEDPATNPLYRKRNGYKNANATDAGSNSFSLKDGSGERNPSDQGRWPANIIHDGSEEVISAFPEAQGQQAAVTGKEPSSKTNNVYSSFNGRPATSPRGDSGSAARFFYCAKASKEDRDEGLANFARKQRDGSRKEGNPGGDNPRNRGLALRTNHHPTVKPTELMRYLCRLITPPGGIVLDPFMGSGSTGKAAVKDGFRFIGIEREEEYFEIACARIRDAQRQPDMFHAANCQFPAPLLQQASNNGDLL